MTDDEVREAAADLIVSDVRDYRTRHELLSELTTAEVVRNGKSFGIVLPSLADRETLDGTDATRGFARIVLAGTRSEIDDALSFA